MAKIKYAYVNIKNDVVSPFFDTKKEAVSYLDNGGKINNTWMFSLEKIRVWTEWKEVATMAEKLYTCYETNQTMNKKDWFLYYLTSDEIDKTEYRDFSDWWHDMRKSGVIEVA